MQYLTDLMDLIGALAAAAFLVGFAALALAEIKRRRAAWEQRMIAEIAQAVAQELSDADGRPYHAEIS